MCMIGMSNNKLLLNWRLKYETNYKNILKKREIRNKNF